MLLLSPVQINEEAEQVVTQFDHGLLHVGLQLTSVVDLSGVKHAHVSHRNLHVPEVTQGHEENKPQVRSYAVLHFCQRTETCRYVQRPHVV